MKKIKINDIVQVISGSEKGKQGKVVLFDSTGNRLKIEGVWTAKKAIKPTSDNPSGGFVELAKFLHKSKVALVLDGKVGRVGFSSKGDRLIKGKR